MCICDINVFKSNRMQKVQFCEKTSFLRIVVAGIVVVVVGGNGPRRKSHPVEGRERTSREGELCLMWLVVCFKRKTERNGRENNINSSEGMESVFSSCFDIFRRIKMLLLS